MNMKKAAVLIMGVTSFLFISLIILLFAVPSGDKVDHVKAEPQLNFSETEYQQLEKKVIDDAAGAIISIKRQDRLFDITVPYSWYDLTESRKKEVADFINKKIYNIAVASELIKPGGGIDVMLVDPSGKELKY